MKNLSVAVGTGSPDPTNGYAAVTATGTDTCVNVTCTSSTPIDLTVTLKDAAGNPTVKTISQIACATTLPGVQIVSPHSETTATIRRLQRSDPAPAGGDLGEHAARIRTPSRPAPSGRSSPAPTRPARATLFGGTMGGNPQRDRRAAPTIAAVSADGCPNGYSQRRQVHRRHAARTARRTPTRLLASPTELRVDVTTPASATGSSPPVDLWVDSSAPNIQPYLPNPLCGLIHQGDDRLDDDGPAACRRHPAVTLTVQQSGRLNELSDGQLG